MDDVEQRLRQLIEVADPDGTVTVRWLAALIGKDLDRDSEPDRPAKDLTVEEVADHFSRSPSTVRGWLQRGELRGYKLNRRDWRVPLPALDEYERQQRGGGGPDTDGDVDITEWRRAS